jgi:hypothetical protein
VTKFKYSESIRLGKAIWAYAELQCIGSCILLAESAFLYGPVSGLRHLQAGGLALTVKGA